MEKLKRFIKKRGLLLAAVLCAAAVGVAGVNTINEMITALGEELQPELSAPVKPDPALPAPKEPLRQKEETRWETEEYLSVPVVRPESEVEKPSSVQPLPPQLSSASSEPGTEPAVQVVQPSTSSPRYVRPVDGKILEPFSGEELVYDRTMDDWRTHNGTDFAAAPQEQVHSITSGTVCAVREDALWGWVVEVASPEGVLRYAGLAPKPPVQQGDAVSTGQLIGLVDSADAEAAMPVHLHVEYEAQEQFCDVMRLLDQ